MIAAVDGLAIGVGTTMLLHCDLVYATPAASLRTPFLDLGLIQEAGSTITAPARIGYPRAFEMICLGEPFSAERALQAGLINAIVPADQLEATALQGGQAAGRQAARGAHDLAPPAAPHIAEHQRHDRGRSQQLHQADGARPRPGKPSPPSWRSARPTSPRPARRAADVRQKGGVETSPMAEPLAALPHAARLPHRGCGSLLLAACCSCRAVPSSAGRAG